jgi:hypothetical protein
VLWKLWMMFSWDLLDPRAEDGLRSRNVVRMRMNTSIRREVCRTERRCRERDPGQVSGMRLLRSRGVECI